MNEFLSTVLSFPTLPWTILLAFCLIYWSMSALGIVDLGDHVDIDMDVGDVMEGGDGPHGLGAIFSRIGLSGIPFMIILLTVSFIGWITSYYIHILFLGDVGTTGRMLIGIGTCIATFVFAIIAAAFVLRPLRKWLEKLKPPSRMALLGRVGTVISPMVNSTQGRAEFPNGGAGLVYEVRSTSEKSYPRGTKVVLMELDDKQHFHKVISQDEFNAL